MEKILLVSFLITCMFSIIKIIEMKYLEKEMKPIKYIMRDALIVFVCTVAGVYAMFYMNGSLTSFLNIVTETKTLNPDATEIFTDQPEF
jgi:hypothetical protein